MSSTPQQTLVVFGASHRSAPLDILERFALSEEEIHQCHQLLSPLCSDAVVLSTCNRTEIYANIAQTDVPELNAALTKLLGKARMPAEEHCYTRQGDAALAHLARVAAGIESLVLGETQILGQARTALDLAKRHAPLSSAFERALQWALNTAKKCRAETAIGAGAVSVASAAVQLASRTTRLERSVVIVVGAGDTGRLLCEHFQTERPARLVIVNRTFETAQTLARSVGAEALPWEQLPALWSQADIVATALRVQNAAITKELIAPSLGERGGRPLAIIDTGLPRNVASSVGDLPGVFVHDLDSLRHVVDQNLAKRQREVARVQALIDDELQKFADARREASAGPLIAALRETVEVMRQAEVEKAAKGLSAREVEAVDRATRAVVNKLLHGPVSSIKQLVRDAETPDKVVALSDAVERLRKGNG